MIPSFSCDFAGTVPNIGDQNPLLSITESFLDRKNQAGSDALTSGVVESTAISEHPNFWSGVRLRTVLNEEDYL